MSPQNEIHRLKWRISRLENKISSLESEKERLQKTLRIKSRDYGEIYIQRRRRRSFL